MKLAGAPISWGVCEVPGWGWQMSAERVLHEMRQVGLGATELGPPEFLPYDAHQLRLLLDQHGLRLVGGFVAAVLHRPRRRRQTLAEIKAAATALASGGGDLLILAVASEAEGYDQRDRLEDADWRELAITIAQAEDIAAEQGLTLAFHPHIGTAIERPDEVDHLLAATRVGLCLDSGHLFIAGASPSDVAAAAGDRVVHVHLKDVDESLARRVRDGELRYSEAVARGLYRPLGDGDVDIAALVTRLRYIGFDGWYVLEQDVALSTEPPSEAGPIDDVQRSVAFINQLFGDFHKHSHPI